MNLINKIKYENISGIYKIYNKLTHKYYIGYTCNLYSRNLGHRASLRSNTHKNSYLQKSWNKYDENDFEFQIMKFCKEENLEIIEDFLIRKHKTHIKEIGYNIKIGNELSQEIIEKFKRDRKGKYRKNIIAAQKARLVDLYFIGQYDLEGNLVKIWENSVILLKEINMDRSAFHKCCKYSNRKLKEYMWKYIDIHYPDKKISPYNTKKNKRVVYEINNETIIFRNHREASIFFKKDISTIAKWLNGKLRFTKEGKLYY